MPIAVIVLIIGITSTFSLASGQRARAASGGFVNKRMVVDLASLKQYVKFGEQALERKDLAGAFSWSERSLVLLYSFPDDIRKLLEVVAVQARLENLRSRIKESENISLRLDAGLKGIVGPSPVHTIKSQVDSNRTKVATVGAVHQFTTKKRGFMEKTLSRASQYLPMVHQIFAEECVPQDLAYLAVIESGFINSASSCANAVGMWQFMRSTGHIYGLSGNTWVEERRDPVKATRAAAKYLKQLYTVSGDWYLALVGYNAGPSAANRAIHNLGTRNFWDMHRSRWLRDQTKNYVPELCAAILIGRFPEHYGLKVEQLAPYAYETVEVDRMTSLPVLARYSGNDVNKLKELNSELLRNTTPPGKYMLRVPPGMGDVTTRALADIPDDQRLDFVSYCVSKKDSLAIVAARFNVSTNDLLCINNIRYDQFLPGLVIKVPPPLARSTSSKHLSKDEHIQHIKEKPLATNIVPYRSFPTTALPLSSRKRRLTTSSGHAVHLVSRATIAHLPGHDKTVLISPSKPPVKQKTNTKIHVVKSGDSLFSIANYYKIDLKVLKKLNNIKLAEIRIGQQLHLR